MRQTVRGSEYGSFFRKHQNRIHSFRTTQRFDRLQSSLCDRPADIEGRVYGDLDADSAAQRLQIGIGKGVRMVTDDLQSPRAIRVYYGGNTLPRAGPGA